MLASFCDMPLPVTVHHTSTDVGRRFRATASLQLDDLAPVPLGDRIQGVAQVLRVTRSMVFTQRLVTADGVPAVRCSSVFKLGAAFGDDAPR